MRILFLIALFMCGCADLLGGVGGSFQAQGYRSQPSQTSCFTHCYAGNCSTTCN